MIEAHQFLMPVGPGPHESRVRCGSTHARTNVRLACFSQRVLLQAQLRVSLTLRHVESHGGNAGDECADHVAALGAPGLVSNHSGTLVVSTV